jgi:hypothetical protein
MARTRSGRTLAELGELSGMSNHGVSKAVQRMSARLSAEKKPSRSLRNSNSHYGLKPCGKQAEA